MTDMDIQQSIATGQARLNKEAYSRYLKANYGLTDYCPEAVINCLLLLLWAAGAWDNREGAHNAYPVASLKIIIAKINSI